LSVHTYKAGKAYQQAYFAGYLEGRMMSNEIYDFYDNLRINNGKKKSKSFELLKNFFNTVVVHLSNKVKNIANIEKLEDRKYWSQLALSYSQLEGLHKGYNYEVTKRGEYEKKNLTIADFLILQADGEIPELMRYMHAVKQDVKIGDKNYFKKAFGINTKDPAKFWGELMWQSRCSALIKLTKDEHGNWKDLLTGHNTWSPYSELIRTFKQ
jgi:hypothetical protein